jgi:hypothetical protein
MYGPQNARHCPVDYVPGASGEPEKQDMCSIPVKKALHNSGPRPASCVTCRQDGKSGFICTQFITPNTQKEENLLESKLKRVTTRLLADPVMDIGRDPLP